MQPKTLEKLRLKYRKCTSWPTSFYTCLNVVKEPGMRHMICYSTYREVIMFVNSAEQLDQNERLSEVQKEGLRSATVFTEIDHNYVNPSSREHQELLNTMIEPKEDWASAQALKVYSSAYDVFNEYMTHGLFCMYVQETYSPQDTKMIIEERVQLMKRRGFSRYQAFNDMLLNQFDKTSRSKTIYEYYADILKATSELK